MKSGRNSSHQSHYVVAVFSFLLTVGLLSARTAQSQQADSPKATEARARAAIEKYVEGGQAKDYLEAVIKGLNDLPSNYDNMKTGFNKGIADSLEHSAILKRDNPNFRKLPMSEQDQTFPFMAAQITTEVRKVSLDPMQSENSPQRQKAKTNIEIIDGISIKLFDKLRAAKQLPSDFIIAAPATTVAQEPQAAGKEKKYDPTKSVGLEGATYRDMLKTAAPVIDHLLANANVDQMQAQNAVAFERAATINNTLESSRKLPGLVVSSLAFEARSLSPEELDKVRKELRTLVTSNSAADSDLVKEAIEMVVQAAQKGVDTNTPAFEKTSAALKGYVADALHHAETASTTPGAGSKGGAQQHLQ